MSRHQHGIALIELIIVVGVILAASVAVFTLTSKVSDKADIRRQVEAFTAFVKVLDSPGLIGCGHFMGLTAARIYNDPDVVAILPPDMVDRNAGGASGLRSRWGAIDLAPWTPEASRPAAGYTVSYYDVPAKLCPAFVRSAYRVGFGVRVNGAEVHPNRDLDSDADLVSFCNQGSVAMVAFDHDGAGPGRHPDSAC